MSETQSASSCNSYANRKVYHKLLTRCRIAFLMLHVKSTRDRMSGRYNHSSAKLEMGRAVAMQIGFILLTSEDTYLRKWTEFRALPVKFPCSNRMSDSIYTF